MANIKVHEIEDMVSVDHEYSHGWEVAVVRVMGIPVLYASPDEVREGDLESASDTVREALGNVLGRLLMAEGVGAAWQTKPTTPEPPF